MGQGRDQPRGASGARPVVERGDPDHRGAHQRAVAGAAGVVRRVGQCLVRHHPGRTVSTAQARAGGPEHGRGLQPDVGRIVGQPEQEVRGHGIERLLCQEVVAVRGDVGDAHRHRRVVAPLAGVEVTEAATAHLRELVEGGRQSELVGNAECVTGGLAEQHSRGPVGLLVAQLPWSPAPPAGIHVVRHLKMLTPPGPTSSPTTISKMP